MNLIVLVKAVLDLAKAIIDLPDWNDEAAIEAWIDGFQAALAKVIVLLTPSRPMSVIARVSVQAKAAEAILAEFVGKKVTDLDWKTLIDWVVNLLCMLFPGAASIIQIVGTILKQLVDLLVEEFDKLDDAARAACKALLV